NGVTPPQRPPAKATNEEYGDGKNIHRFALFDVTFTFTKQDADNSGPSQSHYYVREPALNPNRPRDWTSPVDYRNGTVHIRVMKDKNNLHAHKRPDPEKFFPTRVRITMIQVSAGAKYDPALVPNIPHDKPVEK